MFRNAAEARAKVIEQLVSEGDIEPPVTAAEVEQILSHLAPQFWIGPARGAEELPGRTRFGGGTRSAQWHGVAASPGTRGRRQEDGRVDQELWADRETRRT